MPQEPRQRDGCRFTAQNITAAQEKNPFAKISDIVYELLEKAIFSSAIPPGSKLNISKLAEQMGVSTSPVTRAVERLEENGLVTAVRSSDSKYRSYFVFDLSGESLEDLFVARRAIEGEAAFLCAQKRALIDLPRLQKLADQFQIAWQDFAQDLDSAPTVSERAKIDLEFHHQLVLTTENKYLIDMFETLQGTLHYLSIRSCEFVATERKKDNLIVMGSQHVAICSAIGLGLPELARSAMERLGLWQHFRFAVSCVQYGGKTRPDIYLEAARRLGTAPAETVVFEDALHAARTAHEAGFRVCGVWDASAEEDQAALKALADWYVRDLGDWIP